MKNIFFVYITAISIISIILTVYDKIAAKKRKNRIPENTLMLLGLSGGALPMLITMQIIRHKTKHLKFMIGLPVEIVIQIIIAVTCLR